jgi:hypothetical protein
MNSIVIVHGKKKPILHTRTASLPQSTLEPIEKGRFEPKGPEVPKVTCAKGAKRPRVKLDTKVNHREAFQMSYHSAKNDFNAFRREKGSNVKGRVNFKRSRQQSLVHYDLAPATTSHFGGGQELNNYLNDPYRFKRMSITLG